MNSNALRYLEEEIEHNNQKDATQDFILSFIETEKDIEDIKRIRRQQKKQCREIEEKLQILGIDHYKADNTRKKIEILSKIEKLKHEKQKLSKSIIQIDRALSTVEHNNKKYKDNKINDSDIQRAREYPIANIADRHCDLISAGVNRIKAKCPFHVEKTPSFVLYLDNNTYHCFGCSEHGDNIDLYMKLDNADFIQAVRFLSFKS